MAGGEDQRSRHHTGQIAQRPATVVHFGQNAPRSWQQHGSGLRQPHRPAQAVEQPSVQFRFQDRDPFAHRRLGQMQAVGGLLVQKEPLSATVMKARRLAMSMEAWQTTVARWIFYYFILIIKKMNLCYQMPPRKLGGT